MLLRAVNWPPLNIKNGHYPNLQRFPDALDIIRVNVNGVYKKISEVKKWTPRPELKDRMRGYGR